MSKPLSVIEVTALPVQSYAALRPTLKSGDLLFCSGTYAVSRLIEEATQSPWSHVALVLRAEKLNRLLLLESVEDFGVRMAPLSKYLKNYQDGKPYDGPLVLARCSQVTDANLTAIAQFGVDQLTRPYGNEEIGELVARIALGMGRKTATSGYICSELVEACLKAGGIVVQPGAGGFTTPENVWRDPTVSLLGRIH